LKIATEYATSSGGKAEATVVGSSIRTNAESAAFANGTLGHGFEIDDAYPPGLLHPGAVIISAALAAAERDRLSGKDLLVAVILGYDVMCRVGCSLSPTQLYRGFHPTSVAGPIGAAAAVGKLLHLHTSQMINALAIGASHSGGLTECYKSGGEIKRYHAGIAAGAGVRAADLARLGLTGPRTILEGPLGIRAMCDDFRVSLLTTGLGEWFAVNQVWVKKYCCNGMLHAPLDALAAIQLRRPCTASEVRRTTVGSNRHAIHEVGSIRKPQDIFGIQFSMPFTLAVHLVHGDTGLARYTDSMLEDRDVARVADRIFVETDPVIDALFPGKIGGKVRVEFADETQECETVEDCSGSPGNPQSNAERLCKVHDVAGMVLATPAIERLISTIENLEDVTNLRDLTDLLTWR
jgi:2-methylcitrate dehydratase PrpD